jgi:hypothetical protein
MDTNFWKSFVHARLSTALGDAASLSFFGHNPDEHRLIADHVVAEVAIRTSGRGRVVDEWRAKPDRPDNHWFDAICGCASAASLCGAVLPGVGNEVEPPKKQKRLSFRELQERHRASRPPNWHPPTLSR